MGINEVFRETFGTWFRNAHRFGLVALALYAPVVAVTAVWLRDPFHRAPVEVVAQYLLIAPILQTYVINRVAGSRASPLRILPAFAVNTGYVLVQFTGALLLFVPGLLATLVFYLAVPATVVERTGLISSFTRSARLTRGHRMDLLAVLLVFECALTIIPVVALLPFVLAERNVSVISGVVAALIASLRATLLVVVYRRLRASDKSAAESRTV